MVPHELQDLLERMESHREELLRQVLGLAEDEAAQRPAEGEWSVKEQLYHLIEGEESWVRWALMARELPGSEVGPLPGTGNPPGFPDVERVPLATLVAELRAARQKTLAAIGSLTEEELGRRGRHRLFGELTVLQMLRSLYRHDRLHADQMAGRPSSFVLRDQQGRQVSM